MENDNEKHSRRDFLRELLQGSFVAGAGLFLGSKLNIAQAMGIGGGVCSSSYECANVVRHTNAQAVAANVVQATVAQARAASAVAAVPAAHRMNARVAVADVVQATAAQVRAAKVKANAAHHTSVWAAVANVAPAIAARDKAA